MAHLAIQLQHAALEERVAVVHAPRDGRVLPVRDDDGVAGRRRAVHALDGVGEHDRVAVEEEVGLALADDQPRYTCGPQAALLGRG